MGQKRTYGRGDVIVSEGAETTEAFVIERGRVEIYGASGQRLRVLGAGDLFGEMALVSDEPRSSSVRALEEVVVGVIDRETFHATWRTDPDTLLPVLRTLCDRVRALTALVAELSQESPRARASIAVHLEDEAGGPAGPTLTVTGLTPQAQQSLGRRVLRVERFPLRIGRRGDEDDPLTNNELALTDEPPFHVSRSHCVVALVTGRMFVLDRGSRLGTLVNGVPIGRGAGANRTELRGGDNELVVGGSHSPHRFRLSLSAPMAGPRALPAATSV
ncbi:MAG: cyclic nucleotide-binding domain-containing protein [Proteobacteria bacterium]|nr:cyclic nucleotide-binding domain-containing protein [Pseudomonadota bacterium]